jgi:pSer/pThr/pTyr-binding forkhead associated (FHA) protein
MTGIVMARLIDQFEQLLEHTIEEKLFVWLPKQTPLQDALIQILTVVAESQETGKNHPNMADYMIKVSPEDYSIWFSNQIDLVNFSRTLMDYSRKVGMELPKPPAFHIISDPSQESGAFDIHPIMPEQDASDTQYLGSISNPPTEKSTQSLSPSDIHAYLTNSENEIFTLTKPVTNIGRRDDNDIIIPDQKVSRQHAQIRWAHQHYMIFDLDSTGGTFVNNQKICQATLASGDVISFAGELMIYGEDIIVSDSEDTDNLNGTTSTPPPVDGSTPTSGDIQ